ncbi:MAG: response regulator [Ginsengibacter sp.]
MKKRILIYDDDHEILEVCKAILGKYYHIETQVNCDNVMSDVSELNPDVILMDLWIPKIGGEKAIALLKGDSELRKVPVLIFSANDDTEKISQRINADGYLKKPFDLVEFKNKIQTAIDLNLS